MVANFSLLLQLRLPKQKGRTIMVTNKAMHNLISIYICIERERDRERCVWTSAYAKTIYMVYHVLLLLLAVLVPE